MKTRTIRIASCRRGRGMPAPVLTVDIHNMALVWTFSGPEGDWVIFRHVEGVDAPGVFIPWHSHGAGARSYGPLGDDPADTIGWTFYVLTQDEFGQVLSSPSNIVSFGA